MVVLKYIGLGGMYMGNGKYEDMNLLDFRNTADFFLRYPFSADEQAAFENHSFEEVAFGPSATPSIPDLIVIQCESKA